MSARLGFPQLIPYAIAKQLNRNQHASDMVARHRIATGKALLPGYFWISLLDMHEDGEMFVTEHQVPLDVSLEAFVHHFDMIRPADSEDNKEILRRLTEELDGAVEKFRGETRNALLQMREAAHAGCFRLETSHSERKTWHHILHGRNRKRSFIKLDDLPMPSSWRKLDGAGALVNVKEVSTQQEVPLLARVSVDD